MEASSLPLPPLCLYPKTTSAFLISQPLSFFLARPYHDIIIIIIIIFRGIYKGEQGKNLEDYKGKSVDDAMRA